MILEYVEKLLPGSANTQMYKDMFASLDDQAFDDFMAGLEEGTKRLAIVAPNLSDTKLSIERNLDLAEELGHQFFERIWIDNGNDIPRYLSPIPYLIVDIPLRRQAQLLVKKISIPSHNHSVDDLTGQPTGESKGSKISYPELQIMSALDLNANATEMLKYRGGDVKGFDAMNKVISKTGGVSLVAIDGLGTKVKSTETLHLLLTAAHLENTL